MNEKILKQDVPWQGYSFKIATKYDLKKDGSKHFSGPCPRCGGVNRFYIGEKNGTLLFNCNQGCEFKDLAQIMRDDGVYPELPNPNAAPQRPTVSNDKTFRHELPGQLYHEMKGVKLHGARVDGKTISVSMQHADGQPAGEQRINPNGFKKFTRGMKTKGAHAVLGGDVEAVTYLCEGWATAASATEATGRPAVFCGSAKNLPIVAAALQEKHPATQFLVAADNDEAGIDAAEATGLPWTVPSQVGHDWNDVHQALGLEAVAAEIQGNVVQPRHFDAELSGFKILSASELASKTFAPIKYLVPGILPSIGLTMISGAPKVGKSYFCLYLVSQFQSDCGILYLGLEDNFRRLQQRNAQIFPYGAPSNLKMFAGLSSESPVPRGELALRFIRQLKQKYPDIGCVFVDTVANIRERSGREKNYDVVEAEFAALRKLSHELKIAIVAVHHNRKRTETDASPLEQILGSQGISATVETALILQQAPGTQDVDLFATGKDVEQQEIRYKWDNPGFIAVGDVVTASLGWFQRDCLDHIKAHPRCMQAGIVAATGKLKSQVSEAVKALCERGLVQKDDHGRLSASTKEGAASQADRHGVHNNPL